MAFYPPPAGLYSLSPECGSIPAGSSQEVMLRFRPTEVEDCGRLLVCDILDLDASCQQLARPVTGKVRVSCTSGSLTWQPHAAKMSLHFTNAHQKRHSVCHAFSGSAQTRMSCSPGAAAVVPL